MNAGLIEIITCGATHGYLPLLGTDASVRAQVRTAVKTHIRHFGHYPSRHLDRPSAAIGPQALWQLARPQNAENPNDSDPSHAHPHRPQLQPHRRRAGPLRNPASHFFFVDTHLVEESRSRPLAVLQRVPYGVQGTFIVSLPSLSRRASLTGEPRSVYRTVRTSKAHIAEAAQPGALRPPSRSSLATHAPAFRYGPASTGYPGDGDYLDFHKSAGPAATATGASPAPNVDHVRQAALLPPRPPSPASTPTPPTSSSSSDTALNDALKNAAPEDAPPILCSLRRRALRPLVVRRRTLARSPRPRDPAPVRPPASRSPRPQISSHRASSRQFPHKTRQHRPCPEGSWGAEGTNQVWLNPETAWTWSHHLSCRAIYLREVCTSGQLGAPLSARHRNHSASSAASSSCSKSSDWQFLITTGAARDYAELRFLTHNDQFTELSSIWQSYEQAGSLNEHQANRLAAIQDRDNIFPDVDPSFWAAGATATPPV